MTSDEVSVRLTEYKSLRNKPEGMRSAALRDWIIHEDVPWLLTRLKRAKELLSEHMRFDQMKEPEVNEMWEATTAFLSGAEDEGNG